MPVSTVNIVELLIEPREACTIVKPVVWLLTMPVALIVATDEALVTHVAVAVKF
jgi:hypothetical protein